MKVSDVAWFWAMVIRFEARKFWQALPGPWYVKVVLIIICLAIPGELDEIALVAVTAACRAYQARKEQAA